VNGSYDSHKSVKFGVDGQQDLQLEEVDITSVVDSSFVYPSYKSVKDKEIKEIPTKLVFHYKCNSNRCEFPMTALKESMHLKSCGIKETTEVIVHTIDSNQQLFTARQCGGYIFQAAGKSLFLIQNDSVVPNDETCFGFVDLTKARRRLIHQYEMNKLRSAQAERMPTGQKTPSAVLNGSWTSAAIGTGFGAAAMLGTLKFLKKI